MVDPMWILKNSNASKIIGKELTLPIYHPRKKDGGLRKYRFPIVRAKNLVSCATILYYNGNGLISLLRSNTSEEKTRDCFTSLFPGMGLKESSHFLRNIRYSSRLAIIDVHIISFLKRFGLLPEGGKTITYKRYLQIEETMREISDIYRLELSVLDNAIWKYMRMVHT